MTNSLKIVLLLSIMIFCIESSQFTIRECIRKQSGGSVQKICGAKNNTSCYNGYYSLNLCLANNKCYEIDPNQKDMPYNCWHCWAQLQVESQDMKQFQTLIRGCWELNIKFVIGVVGLLLMLII